MLARFHRPWLFAVVAAATVGTGAGACEVTLAWDASPDTNVVGYALYAGTESGNYTERRDLQNQLSTSITNLVPGADYFFVVTAYTADLIESLPSNEVRYLVPGGLRFGTVPGRGLVLVRFVGPVGSPVTLQASEDLQVWRPLYQFGSVGPGMIEIVDPESARYGQRFYRLAGTNAALPALTCAQVSAPALARMDFVIPTGLSARIEASENLVDWSPLQTIRQLTNTWVEFTDPDSALLPRRFYRIVPED